MRFMGTGSRAAALAVVVGLAPAVAPAQTVESPPDFTAAQAAQRVGIPPKGGNYTIQDPVRSDGMLRVYRLTTAAAVKRTILDAHLNPEQRAH